MYTIRQINPDGNIVDNVAVPQKLQQTLNLIDELNDKQGVFVIPENFGGKRPDYFPRKISNNEDLMTLYIHLWGHTFQEQHQWQRWMTVWFKHFFKDFDEFWEDYV